jgi:hypothetical protein
MRWFIGIKIGGALMPVLFQDADSNYTTDDTLESAVGTLDVLMSEPKADTLIIHRPTGGTSGLSYDWFRFK